MPVTTDIVKTYRAPRQVIRRHLAAGVREDRALAFLMAACALIFVAQWPRLARQAYLTPEVPLEALIGAALLGWLFLAPLFLYLLGAASHLVARLFGGRGSFYAARLALFWSLLAVSPLMLLQGLVAGFIGPGPALTLVGYGVLLIFLVLWGLALHEAERAPAAG